MCSSVRAGFRQRFMGTFMYTGMYLRMQRREKMRLHQWNWSAIGSKTVGCKIRRCEFHRFLRADKSAIVTIITKFILLFLLWPKAKHYKVDRSVSLFTPLRAFLSASERESVSNHKSRKWLCAQCKLMQITSYEQSTTCWCLCVSWNSSLVTLTVDSSPLPTSNSTYSVL
jgi:hypothetical protein